MEETLNAVAQQTTYKHNLQGITLASGWKITQQLPRAADATGGNFGVGYIATRDGETAFVKAIDFVLAMRSTDPVQALADMTNDALFERNVLEYCTSKGMSHVLRFFGSEYVTLNPNDLMSRVLCIVMEVGDRDLRRERSMVANPSCVWTLKVMSDIALALTQLHRGGIAHQDLKPSNVIAVSNGQPDSQVMKIGDLGRVTRQGEKGPFDHYPWPGDPSYTPPEIWYSHYPSDWNDKREAADAYMLGSILVFLCTGVTLQTLVVPLIPHQYHPRNWGGAFDKDLIPVLLNFHAVVLETKVRPVLMPEIADELMKIAYELTHPDPKTRGDVQARRVVGNPVGLNRIQQRIHGLYVKAAAIERGRGAR